VAVALPAEFVAVTEHVTARPCIWRATISVGPRPIAPGLWISRHRYAYDVGAPDQLPRKQCSRLLERVTRGGLVAAGLGFGFLVIVTTPVGADTAGLPAPWALLAVSRTRIVWPTSDAWSL
jgi:hypothetical protein